MIMAIFQVLDSHIQLLSAILDGTVQLSPVSLQFKSSPQNIPSLILIMNNLITLFLCSKPLLLKAYS